MIYFSTGKLWKKVFWNNKNFFLCQLLELRKTKLVKLMSYVSHQSIGDQLWGTKCVAADWTVEKENNSLLVQNRVFFPQFTSWKINHNKYSLKKIVDSEFEIGETKGQLISEWLFGVFNFPKNQDKNLMNFCPRLCKVVKSDN